MIQEMYYHTNPLPETAAEETFPEAKPKPLLATGLGKLAPEIREKIFTDLLATPPSYAGHVFASNSSCAKASSQTPVRFVDITASWYKVTQTCRQIYLESYPLFFAAKAYYLAKPQDLTPFFEGAGVFGRPLFRYQTITAMCLKDLVQRSPIWSQQELDEIFSNPLDFRARHFIRQELETITTMSIQSDLCFHLRAFMNLRVMSLCFAVGEEMEHVDFLFGVTGMRRGLVEFLDARHWLIRPQSADEVWKTQYAGFTYCDHRDKNEQHIPYDLRSIQREVTDIDSRALGLQEGDERYVEVQIRRPTKADTTKGPLDTTSSDIDWEASSDDSDVDLFDTGSPQIQDETSQTQSEDSEPSGISEDEGISAELEPKSGGRDNHAQNDAQAVDQASLEAQSQQSCESHAETEIGEGKPTLEAKVKEDYGRTKVKSLSSQSQIPLLDVVDGSNPYTEEETELYEDAETGIGEGETTLDDGRTNVKYLSSRSQIPSLDAVDRPNPSTEEETELFEDAETGTGSGKTTLDGDCTNVKYLSSQSQIPLLDAVDRPNPSTEEEMDVYENWQRSGTALEPYHKERPPRSDFSAQPTAEQPIAQTGMVPNPHMLLRYLFGFIRLLTSLLILALLNVVINPDEEHFCGQLIALYSAVVLMAFLAASAATK